MKRILPWATVVTTLMVAGVMVFPGVIDLFKGMNRFYDSYTTVLALEILTRQKTSKTQS